MRSFVVRVFTVVLALCLPREGGAQDAKPQPGTPEYAAFVALRASKLPIPVAPPVPAQRKAFEIPVADPTLVQVKRLTERIAGFPNMRARSPASVWRVSDTAVFTFRGQQDCHVRLSRGGVTVSAVTRRFPTPVPVPVAVIQPVDEVAFISAHGGRPIKVACELAARLPAIAKILREFNVTEVGIISDYRDHPFTSFHTFGLALDIGWFKVAGKKLVVARDFEITPDSRTCEASPKKEAAKSLLAIACALANSDAVNTIITPNYNQGHHDHFHLDIRPDDPRVFIR